MAIGLVQWFSFGAMLGAYFKSFEVVTLGSKSNRFAIPKLECGWVVVSFAAGLLGLRNLYILHLSFTYINFFVNFSFNYDLVIIVIAKAFLY